jgi:hypothetical protein
MSKRQPATNWSTDFDHLDPRWIENPYPIWDELRQSCPIAHTERFMGAYFPSRYEDVRESQPPSCSRHANMKLARQKPEKYPWLTQLLARKPFKVVAVALANKMARIAWALLVKGGPYRARALVAAV